MASDTNVSISIPINFFPPPFRFEQDFDMEYAKAWTTTNSHLSLFFCAAYLVLLRLSVIYMEKKPAMNLKWALIIWNLSLALMSILGATRMITNVGYMIRHYGLEKSICKVNNTDSNPVFVSSVYIFFWSKVIEMVDTFFIVLRKKNLIFLHWFHHCSVLVFTWFSVGDRVPMGFWFIAMNYTVHAFMYSYYALRALNVKILKTFSMALTLLQIAQMIVGFVLCQCVLFKWFNGVDCDVTKRVLIMGTSLYTLYFSLFVKFFIETYFRLKLRKTVKVA